MISFLVRLFAVIGVIVTLAVVLAAGGFAYFSESGPSEPDDIVLALDFDQPIVEKSEPSPLDLAMHEDSTPLLDVLHAIDMARMDTHVRGIVARFGTTLPSLAQAQEIRAALARFRATGKFAYAFGASYGDFGPGNGAYYLASGFEQIWLQPVGAVGLMSVNMEAPFAKTALDKLGVQADFLRREEYKSVMENVTRDDFSAPVRANMQSLIDDLSDQVAAGIAEGRQWEPAHVKDLMEKGPFTAAEAIKEGLVTKIGYSEDMMDAVKKAAGENVQQASVADYLSYGSESGGKPKARVALIYATGMIADHAVGPPDLTGEEVMGADEVADALNDAAEDDGIKAVLFRIDSPGGSPSASETIRSALLHVQKMGKPVYVTMGNMAASGGYWIAMSADHIVAEPGTLTGSIGVVAGKFVLGGLMEKLGIRWDRITTGANAGMWSITQGFDATGQARVNALLDETYRAFTQGVSEARKIPMEKMGDVAKGRVFSGAQAERIGLVDELGGYDVAIGSLRKKLNLGPDDKMSIELMPAPLSPAERVMKLLKNIGVESISLQGIATQMGRFQVAFGPFWGELTDMRPAQVKAPLTLLRSIQ